MSFLNAALPLALALLAGAPTGEPVTLKFHGYAYHLETRRYLYTEVHEQTVDGARWLGGKVTYVAADGSVLGSKTLDFSADPFVPVFRMDLVKEGYAEGITDSRGPVEMFRHERRHAVEKGSVERREPMAADSGIHMLIREHFADLMEGKVLRFHLAVAGSLDLFHFRARRMKDTTFEGRPAVRLRLEPSSFLRFITKPLDLTYEAGLRKLVEYRGISNVHDPETGDPYNVYIAYFTRPPADAPALPPGY